MRVLLSTVLVLVTVACDRIPVTRDLYACNNGINVLNTRGYRRSELRLSTGEVRKVRRVPANQGLRYASDQLHWFERGDEAVLSRKGESTTCRLINRNI
jgi:membrane-bound inhibitor of C-type lysozyme